MQTTLIGQKAENVAADYLRSKGYTVLDHNWRHRRAEIDIIAVRNATAYFVEVKYRRNAKAGNGLDYVTAAKQRQMAFAAHLWVAEHSWNDPYQLAAIEVSGADYEVTAFVDFID